MNEERVPLSLRRFLGGVAILALYFAAVARWFNYVSFLEQTGNLSLRAVWITIFLICTLIGISLAAIFLPLVFLLYLALRGLRHPRRQNSNGLHQNPVGSESD